ncbi:MAG: anti-sigma factor [Aeromicrobium sp.]|uniref:anti-sigma factor n=1 Tax=Aeromicrobium sp. TaxID=1871063 RepID=UPI003C453819
MTIDLHSFTAPYALDALDELEKARFEAHLETCGDCREELAGFSATTGRIGDSLRETPPLLLRERLMAEIATTPQQRRLTVDQPGRLRRALPRVAVAAALLVGGFGAGGYALEHQRAQELDSVNVAMTSILGAEDASTETKTFDNGGTVRMVSSASQDSALVVAKNIPAPPDGKVYQVWMIDDAGPRSEGTMTTEGTMIMRNIAGADLMAVTIEPAGGSKQPTTTPIATMAV